VIATALRILSVLIFLASMLIAGCLPWAGVMDRGETGSLGTASRGLLLGGEHLAIRGEHFRFYRARDRRYGIRELTGLVQRVSETLEREFPGTVLLLGDLSGRGGGFISEHHSHRSGRDVDLAFFITSPSGKPIHGWPLTRFDLSSPMRRAAFNGFS
jgi:penicillin-insensitive murein endopeptidase